MSNPKSDPKFNETLRRMMDQKPKPHEDMKKGKDSGSRAINAPSDKKDHE